jgi:hypothetical protein
MARMKSLAVTDAEIAMIHAIRATGFIAAPPPTAQEVSDSLCSIIETALVDANGRRPGSWEADIGRTLLRQLAHFDERR